MEAKRSVGVFYNDFQFDYQLNSTKGLAVFFEGDEQKNIAIQPVTIASEFGANLRINEFKGKAEVHPASELDKNIYDMLRTLDSRR